MYDKVIATNQIIAPVSFEKSVGVNFLDAMSEKEEAAGWSTSLVLSAEEFRLKKHVVLVGDSSISVGDHYVNSVGSLAFTALPLNTTSYFYWLGTNDNENLTYTKDLAFKAMSIVFGGNARYVKMGGTGNWGPTQAVMDQVRSRGNMWICFEIQTSNSSYGKYVEVSGTDCPGVYGVNPKSKKIYCHPGLEKVINGTSNRTGYTAIVVGAPRSFPEVFDDGLPVFGKDGKFFVYYKRHVLGGPQFCKSWTLFTTSNTLQSGLTDGELTIDVKEFCMDWDGSMMYDLEDDPDLKAKYSDSVGQVVRTSVFSAMKTVPSLLIKPLRIYEKADEADQDIDDEILMKANDDLPQVTFGQAQSRGAGKRYQALHAFRLNMVQRVTRSDAVNAELRARVYSGQSSLDDSLLWRPNNQASVSGVRIFLYGDAGFPNDWGFVVKVDNVELERDKGGMAVYYAEGVPVTNGISGVSVYDALDEILGFVPDQSDDGAVHSTEMDDFDEIGMFQGKSVRPWELSNSKEAGFYLLHFGRSRAQLGVIAASMIAFGRQASKNIAGLNPVS